MVVSYNKLWKMLIDRKKKKTDLIELCGISSNVLAKLGRDESVSIDSLKKICKAFNCDIGDIMEFIDDGDDSITIK